MTDCPCVLIRRKMFWTNWNDNQASIMSSYLSGWEVKKIISHDIRTPNGLAIDHPSYKLYWSDARLDKIERCNFDGTDRKVSLINFTIFSVITSRNEKSV